MTSFRLVHSLSVLVLFITVVSGSGCSQHQTPAVATRSSDGSTTANSSPVAETEQRSAGDVITPALSDNDPVRDATGTGPMQAKDDTERPADQPAPDQPPAGPATGEPLPVEPLPTEPTPLSKAGEGGSKVSANAVDISELDAIRLQFLMHNDTSPYVIQALRDAQERMPSVPVAVGDDPIQWSQVTNHANSATLNSGKHRICLFKFRSPLEVPADLHWSFAVSSNLGNWNLLPVKGDTKGFNSFKYRRNVQVPDVPLQPGSLFVFQELTGGKILPGEDYIIWYLPPDGVETNPWVGLRLTEAGSREPGQSAEAICDNLGIKATKLEFPQTDTGLQAAFLAAHQMTAYVPVDRQGAREVLRSVWDQLPKWDVTLSGKSPVWNRMGPRSDVQFYAARFQSTANEITDLNWCMVTKDSLPKWEIFSRQDELESTNAYSVELNCPIGGTSNFDQNLAMFQKLPGGQIQPKGEYAIWFTTSESALEELEVALSLSPSEVSADSDEREAVLEKLKDERRNQRHPYSKPQPIATAIGIRIPETPSSERVDAALEKCRKMIADRRDESWLFTHLLLFAAPGLPVLKTDNVPPEWTDIRLNDGRRTIAAFRIDAGEVDEGRLTLTLVRPNTTISQFNLPRMVRFNNLTDRLPELQPIVTWGITSRNWPGVYLPFRGSIYDTSSFKLGLPPESAIDADVYNEHVFSETTPIVVVVCPPDMNPIDLKIAGILEEEPKGHLLPFDVASIIKHMDFRDAIPLNEGQIIAEHSAPVIIARFFEPGVAVVSGSSRSELKWWVGLPDIEVPNYKRGTQGHTLAFSADRTKLAAVDNGSGTITIHHAGTLEELHTLTIPDERIPQTLSFSPQADRLLASYGGHNLTGSDGIYRKSVHYVWDLKQPKLPPVTREYPLSAAIESGLWLSDGRIAVAGISDLANFRDFMVKCSLAPAEVSFLDDKTLETKESIKGEATDWLRLAESGDGTRLGGVANSGWVTVWDSKTHREIASIPIAMYGRSLSLSKNGRRLAVLGDKVQVWNVDNGRLLSCGPGKLPDASDVSISPAGDKIVLGCNDGTVRLYDIKEVPDADAKGDHALTLTDSNRMKLSWIPAGSFTMGRSLGRFKAFVPPGLGHVDDQVPRHDVNIKRSLYMGQHEVTVGQFRSFVDATGYQTTAEKTGRGGSIALPMTNELRDDPSLNWKNPGFSQQEDHPVVQVSYDDALAFCDWMSKKENARYRLPTEAEWEYACRATTSTPCYYGWVPWMYRCSNIPDAELIKVYGEVNGACGISDGHAYTAPVGSYIPNGFGLYDISGNVWEWCSDWYDAKYYAKSAADDPTGPAKGKMRVQRGGSFYNGFGESSQRDYGPPDQTQFMLGFRIVREVE